MSLKVWIPFNDEKISNHAPYYVDNSISSTGGSVTFQDDSTISLKKCVYFGTTTGYIQLNKDIFTGCTEMSVSLWMKLNNFTGGNPTGTSQYITAFDFDSRSTGYTAEGQVFSFSKYQTGSTQLNEFVFRIADGTTYANALTDEIREGEWNFFAMTYKNNKICIYQNGVLTDSTETTISPAFSSIMRVCIGQSRNASSITRHIDGYISDFRVYDNELTDYDVKRLYESKLFDLIPFGYGHVSLDQKERGLTMDFSGLNLLPLNIPNNISIGIQSLSNFSSSSVIRPIDGNVGFNLSYGTLSIWFTKYSGSATYSVIYVDSTSKMTIGFYNNQYIYVTNGVSSMQYPINGITNGELSNIIVSYSNGGVPSFCVVNGVEKTKTGSSSTGILENNGLTIGGRTYNNTSYFRGKIHRVTTYGMPFTLEQCIETYKKEKKTILNDALSNDNETDFDLDFSGEQWIDTGYKPNQDTVIESIISTNYEDTTWLYSTNNTTNPRVTLIVPAMDGEANQRFGNSTVTTEIPHEEVVKIRQSKNGLEINGVNHSYGTVSDFTTSGNLIIGAQTVNGSTTLENYNGILKYLRILEGNVVKRNFIPVQNGQLGIGWLYDTITKKEFPSIGTDQFGYI